MCSQNMDVLHILYLQKNRTKSVKVRNLLFNETHKGSRGMYVQLKAL